MLRNYIRIAWRNLVRNKTYSLINIAGLAIGMASAVLILLWIANEVSYNPEYPFEYHFVDERYALKFEDTQRTAMLAGLFAGLTILISCLGLFGLATYMAANRTKEIGIRKVLGASVLRITALLAKDFLILVVISIIIATPIAWYSMHQWLQEYPYRVTITWWLFAIAAVLAIVIAIITVAGQAIKAALANPIKSLRTE